MGSRRAKAKRGFGEVSALPSGRFRARYTGPDGNRHSAPITFVARIDAEGWLVDQERMISRGDWKPPARQVREVPLLLGEYAAVVVGRRRLRPATVALYAKLLRLTILPTWADRPLGDITAAEISAWYAGMRKTPTHQANAYRLLKSRLDAESACASLVPAAAGRSRWGNRSAVSVSSARSWVIASTAPAPELTSCWQISSCSRRA